MNLKRVLTLLTLLVLLCSGALADNMTVVNCEEWVSLRKSPSTKAERLRKVPLYEVVEDCEWAENGFVRCTWEGVTGYIQDKYLEPLEPNEAETVLDEVKLMGRVDVLAYRQYDGGERLTVTASASNGDELWTATTGTDDVTELTATDAFIGGTADEPRVMLYNSTTGLSCLDLNTGDTLWELSTDAVHLGASISHAVDRDGTLIIAGYYGPDPVCIDVDGHVLWQANADDENIYWPYAIAFTNRGVETRYEMMPGEVEGTVIYDRNDGHVVAVEPD